MHVERRARSSFSPQAHPSSPLIWPLHRLQEVVGRGGCGGKAHTQSRTLAASGRGGECLAYVGERSARTGRMHGRGLSSWERHNTRVFRVFHVFPCKYANSKAQTKYTKYVFVLRCRSARHLVSGLHSQFAKVAIELCMTDMQDNPNK